MQDEILVKDNKVVAKAELCDKIVEVEVIKKDNCDFDISVKGIEKPDIKRGTRIRKTMPDLRALVPGLHKELEMKELESLLSESELLVTAIRTEIQAKKGNG